MDLAFSYLEKHNVCTEEREWRGEGRNRRGRAEEL